MLKALFWFFIALLVHAGFLLFGKALLPHSEKHEELKVTEVDLSENVKEEDKVEEKEKVDEQVEAPPEQMVDAKMFEEPASAPEAPAALSAMSLSDLAGAMSGAMSDFGGAGGITSGGVIGGTGTGTLGSAMAGGAMDSMDVDERPRAMGAPNIKLPRELKGASGKVIVRLIVDEKGKIQKPQVETSTNSALNQAVLDGILSLRFEPATRGGKKVSCKVRLPIVIGAA
ncbi:MAG: energy transducer TonB [Verrucomicrobiaceae bacterium]|nr:energy transducer TonB [Verrucomicrobiaceae bacterium]